PRTPRVLRAQPDAAVGAVPPRAPARDRAHPLPVGARGAAAAARGPGLAPRALPRGTAGLARAGSRPPRHARSPEPLAPPPGARALARHGVALLLPFRAVARGDSLPAHLVEWHRGARGGRGGAVRTDRGESRGCLLAPVHHLPDRGFGEPARGNHLPGAAAGP